MVLHEPLMAHGGHLVKTLIILLMVVLLCIQYAGISIYIVVSRHIVYTIKQPIYKQINVYTPTYLN